MRTNLEQSDIGLLSGLLFACPLESEANNCPFRSLRKLPVEIRLHLLEDLSKLDQEVLFMHHRKCLCTNDICMKKKNCDSSIYTHSITSFIIA